MSFYHGIFLANISFESGPTENVRRSSKSLRPCTFTTITDIQGNASSD